MSDRNPSTKGKLLAFGKIRDDVFDHVFNRINDDLSVIGLLPVSHALYLLKGKRVRITITQEPER